ncbi:MAG: AAA family ATPase, partial [Sphingobacterium sp.]
MIHYLKIKNFGPVKNEAEINFEVADSIQEDAYEIRMGDGRKLLKLAYIYGANASGKTTILKAFDFLRKILLSPAGDKAQELSFDPFLFCEDAYSKPSYFELSFYVDEIRYLYTLNFTKHSILNEKLVFYQTARPTELFSRQTDPEKRLTKIQFGTKVRVPAREKDLLESNTLHNNTVLGAYAKTNVDIPELEMLNKWFSTYLLGLVTSSHDLTELTAELIDRNPKINEWIDTLLYKADNQIAKVIVPDWNEQVGIPSDQPIQILRPESLSDKTIKRSPVGSLANVDRFFGGPSERKIEFFHK